MIKYKITFQNYREALKLHMGKKTVLIISLFIIPLFLIQLFIPIMNGTPLSLWNLIFLPFLVIAFITFLPIFEKNTLLKQYNEQKTLHEEITLTFDKESLYFSQESGSYNCKWEDILHYKSNGNLILLYETKLLFRIIPVNSQVNETTIEQIENILINSNVKCI